jgi:hypothetical protein
MPELAITTEGWAISRGRSFCDPILLKERLRQRDDSGGGFLAEEGGLGFGEVFDGGGE